MSGHCICFQWCPWPPVPVRTCSRDERTVPGRAGLPGALVRVVTESSSRICTLTSLVLAADLLLKLFLKKENPLFNSFLLEYS